MADTEQANGRRVAVLAGALVSTALVEWARELAQAGLVLSLVTPEPALLQNEPGILAIQPFAGQETWDCLPPCDVVVATSHQQVERVRRLGRPVIYHDVQGRPPTPDVLQATITQARPPKVRGPRLSVCMITKNEEQHIGRALRSACGVAHEIIVVDTGSTDRTVEIARRYGATILHHTWCDDFSAARNAGVAIATGDWILALDADETISDPFRHNWARVVRGSSAGGLVIPVLNLLQGKVAHRSEGGRLFRNFRGYHFRGRIHEQVVGVITERGSQVVPADLPLLHYGYTPGETQRKQRRVRNLGLLRKAYADNPADPLVWHYLGAELTLSEEYEEARGHFGRAITEASGHRTSTISTYMLADIHMRQGNTQAAWEAAQLGLNTRYGHRGALMRLGIVALAEGDFVRAEACAQDLANLSDTVFGELEDMAFCVARFRAGALWEQQRREEALAVWREHLARNPQDATATDLWIRALERARGYRAATVDALREVPTPLVLTTTAGAMIRNGDWTGPLQLAGGAVVSRHCTVYHASALFRAGAVDLAVQKLRAMGVEGHRLLMLWGLQTGNRTWIDIALSESSETAARVAECMLKGTAVGAADAWKLREWMGQAADLRMDDVLQRLTAVQPRGEKEARAELALVLLESARPMDALKLALDCPDQPQAQQVIGLVAFDQGEWPSAAHFLRLRGAHGNAPVRVYWRGALALARVGQPAAAAALLAEGGSARPLSPLLQNPPPLETPEGEAGVLHATHPRR